MEGGGRLSNPRPRMATGRPSSPCSAEPDLAGVSARQPVLSLCQAVAMRLRVNLDDELVAELESRVGKRGRSAFVAEAIRLALDDRHRWDAIEQAVGAIPDEGHEWDSDPAAWVSSQRRGGKRRGSSDNESALPD
jgi:Arc/MetJ family transcription regulator